MTSAERVALLRKYRLLAEWRQTKDKGAARTDTDPALSGPKALRTLSQEFPGALRELDVLGLPEILRRIDQLTRPASRSTSDGTADPGIAWVTWILAYHALMRAALVAKRAYGRTRRISAMAMPQLIRNASATAGVHIDEDFLRAVAQPPGGRLTVVVFATLALRFGVSATKISTTLFPPRRPDQPDQGNVHTHADLPRKSGR